jgi:NADH-quinone oxidoreductase subunit M
MGGLWEQIPVMGGMTLVFVMASLGLPGLGNFIAEFFTLAGTFKANILFSCLASVGLVAGTIYALRIMQKVFYGKQSSGIKIKDVSVRESVALGAMVLVIFYLGIFPQPVINTAKPAIVKTLNIREQSTDLRRNKIDHESFLKFIKQELSKADK